MSDFRFAPTRRALLAAGAATLAAPALIRAQARESVTFRLNWILGGLHLPFYLGRDRGFYAENGIDIQIGEGRGSAATAQLVAARSDQFGMADSGSLMNAAARGAPVRSVMSILNASTFGVITPADRAVRTAADMRGKRFAAAPGGAPAQLLPAVLAANGLRREDVTLVSVDPAAVPVMVLENRADGLLGGVDDQPFILAARGMQTHSVTYASMGVNTVGMTLLAHEETLRASPDMVRRFVAATVRSLDAAAASPEQAVEAGLRFKPDANRDLLLGQLRVALTLVHSPATQGRPTGWASPQDYERSLQIMREFRELQTDRAAASFFTNDFLPRSAS